MLHNVRSFNSYAALHNFRIFLAMSWTFLEFSISHNLKYIIGKYCFLTTKCTRLVLNKNFYTNLCYFAKWTLYLSNSVWIPTLCTTFLHPMPNTASIALFHVIMLPLYTLTWSDDRPNFLTFIILWASIPSPTPTCTYMCVHQKYFSVWILIGSTTLVFM